MDVIIPVRNHPNNPTLKYAIRSICQQHDVTRIVIVGHKPDWFTGFHVEHKDYPVDQIAQNIRDKTIAGAKYTSGQFIFANDDHFLLAPVSQPTHNKGLLSECVANRNPNGSYTKLLQNTINLYGDVPNVDTHCPMIMTTEGVERTAFDWPKWGLGFKTVYAQVNNLSSVYHPDNKTYDVAKVDLSQPYFSTAAGCLNLQLLKKIFTKPSPFEK